ncbi:MAG: enoyl-CoA hydratase/isomerase family protein [Gammaproteobacteria bacterium]|nr:enoyl-CoA hydratase/isomerase family protein [Gammaproteobacteria bacterium]MDH5345038.1 enoyl-CoA hydratase/isomerase family protein [Gammaproteobacteria bacterium]
MSHVLYEKSGPIASLRLNRPEKLNAITREMLDAMAVALDDAAADDKVRVLILSGEGRAFSAGFDLGPVQAADGESEAEFVRRELRHDFDSIMRFFEFPKPVIAAVHGYCLGSSLEIAAVCDLVVAASDCRFGEPEVTFGSGIVCLVLPWIVGQKHAREMLFTGRKDFDADHALAIGLVNRVVRPETLMDEAQALAASIAQNDARAVRMTKKAMNMGLEAAGIRTALEQALEIDIDIETKGG